MRRSKKLLSLVMAMLMAFSLMAVTAAAYDAGHEHDCAVYSEEGIQPRRPAAWCHSCGQAMICYSCQVETYVHEGDKYKFVCPKCGVETSWMGIK